jgi:hypothetical protein
MLVRNTMNVYELQSSAKKILPPSGGRLGWGKEQLAEIYK